VATALKPSSESSFSYVADDYEALLDSPLEIGPHEVHAFECEDRRHELVIHGTGNFDLERMLADMQRIIECESRMFGGLPYDRYLFILHLTHDRGGGLEHANSCTLAWPKLRFRPTKEYNNFLTLVAHEFFHVWNIKRIRPEALRTYDYYTEQYTRLLWVFEGITSYYDKLVPMRAGVYGPKDYFAFVAESMVSEASRPGRLVQSLADSSYDTWIKLYRPSPDALNSQVSYYERGHLVGLLLDLFLRRESGGTRCLDDVMRTLHSMAQRGEYLKEYGFADVVQDATGVDARKFLAQHVDAPGALDYREALAHIGHEIKPKRPTEGRPDPAWLGAHVDPTGGGSRLKSVLTGGPAHRGGLMAGDEIVALDGHRVGGDLTDRLKLYGPNESVAWTAFRRDRLVEGDLTFEANPNPPVEIVRLANATEQQKESFGTWAHAQWPHDHDSDD
jgi:predicted metalloprotease with PDZ domain